MSAALGRCCICRVEDAVGVAMLPYRAPVPGSGWGCVVCGLPLDGAIAVLCESCGDSTAEILDVVVGYAHEGRRVPVDEVRVAPFAHDASLHRAMEALAGA